MTAAQPSQHVAAVVADLAERVRQLERPRRAEGGGVVSTGQARLDALLPERGLRRGTLVEWLSTAAAAGAGTLALVAARQAAEQGGPIVVVDRAGNFYPPGAQRLGIDLARLFVVRPENDADQSWVIDQALRTRGVAAVCAAIDRMDEHTLRRWQLAAETGDTLGLLIRPERVRREPSWAELRLWVEPIVEPEQQDQHRQQDQQRQQKQQRRISQQHLQQQSGRSRRLRVHLLRWRGGQPGRAAEVEIRPPDLLPDLSHDLLPAGPHDGQHDLAQAGPATAWPEQVDRLRRGTSDETRRVHLASQLAAAKTGRRARGA